MNRRKFLLGASAAAILAATPASAWVHGAVVTGFNGGRSQVQSNFLSNGGDYPFRNLLKTSGSWTYINNSGWPAPDEMTSDGLPINPMSGTGWNTAFSKPTQASRAGNYYAITSGSGTIAYEGGSFTAVSGVGNKLLILGSAIPSTSYRFYIQSTSGVTPLSFIAICHEDDIAGVSSANLQSYLEANPFSPAHISLLNAMRPAEIRFLNWQNGNNTTETDWSSRKPTTYWSYAANKMVNQQFNSALNCYVGYVGTCGGGGNAYTVSDTSGTAAPVDKQYLIAKMPVVSVTCTSGADAQITWTGHPLTQNGEPFCLFRTSAGSAPGGITIYSGGTITFYAIIVDANTIKFATTQANAIAGTAITTSSTGSGLLAQATVVSKNASATSIPSSNITFAEPHLMATGASVSIISSGAGNALPNNISRGGTYYAIASSGTAIQLASTLANALANIPITFTGSFGGTITVVKNPTLALNGTTAYPIKSVSGLQVNTDASTSNGTRPLGRVSSFAVGFGILIFDATLQAWLLDGCQDANSFAGVASGIPPEMGVRLCTLIGAHPAYVSPFLSLCYKSGATTGLTDYMPSLMAMVRDTGPSWMCGSFEGFNEDWNFATRGTNYSVCTSFGLWGVTELPAHNYVGRYNSLLGQAANIVYGSGKGTRYHVYIGLQGATIYNPSAAATSNPRFTAASFVASGPALPAGYSQDPAYQWCTHGGGANYFSTNLYATTSGTTNEASMAATWVGNGSSLSDPLLSQYIDACVDAVFNATITGSTMVVNSVTSGFIVSATMGGGNTVYINGPGIALNTYSITGGTGTGGTGSYTLSGSPGNGTYDLRCGLVFSQTGMYNLTQQYLALCQGTAQSGGKWGGVGGYQLAVKFYEGGYSPDLPGGSTNVRQFRWASKFTADSGKLLTGGTLESGVAVAGTYNDIVNLGATRPSLFQLAGGNGAGNPGAASQIWPIYDPDIYIATPPMAAAIIAFNH